MSFSETSQPVATSTTSHRVVRVILARLSMAILCGLLCFLMVEVFATEARVIALMENKHLIAGGWLIDDYRNIRIERVCIFAMLLGLAIPNFKFPDWVKTCAIATVIGYVVALFGLWLMDTILAEISIERAYASFSASLSNQMTLPIGLGRPSPGDKFYPSMFRQELFRVSIGGISCGFLAGLTYATSGRRRTVGRLIVIAIALALSVDVLVRSIREFENYVDWTQKHIRNAIDLKRLEHDKIRSD